MTSDDAAFRLAWQITPHAATEPTFTPDPVSAVASARRDEYGAPTTWPTCARSGATASLAQVLDPIDPLEPLDDTLHLLTAARTREHHAQVLARVVLGLP